MLMCMQLLGYLSLVISVRIGAKIGNIQVHYTICLPCFHPLPLNAAISLKATRFVISTGTASI